VHIGIRSRSKMNVAVLPPLAVLPLVDSSADIVFVIDESWHVGSSRNFETLKSFLVQLVSKLDINSGKTRVGLVTFSAGVMTSFNLNDHSSLTSLRSAISSIVETLAVATTTAAALDYVRTSMFTSAVGDRDNVQNTVVVIAHGVSDDFNTTVVSIEFIVLFTAQCLLAVRWSGCHGPILCQNHFKLLIIFYFFSVTNLLLLLQYIIQ